ncbi:inositol polyphosphate multikinase beta-like [Vitis riparia]|uniref:inositol polyphosphate multikinase beta-like n=1 Tax=Vitis riparia TaxID=96939 RepID=UPI00155A2E5A|nr:inositol polyphosphate multikinase beta-like [Vitis riparia]XP_034673067.1 inositol polyphosphate multikinase beta-like [Vitis riparia]XP_034673068.1 inositol polyphosphate multikinase beta-like [Vitis riparia]XP_034673069.1 inositol polyphosphate multikinase beta-like [Vitis riparia]XP_034673070.1 inositol polyphosphate multikinase beta-like [Vitis riparia]XP_034673071.1 inositol polyphosphate multikinase beta-like [Vitis riparia]XP_034673072.1 inositol polyphosphate multikinase beta-like
MLKVPDHQVAGHHARDGKLGPLIDDSGRFYKPLQGDERGSKEVAFYTSFSSNARIPDHIHRFFPIFYGTQLLEASDGSGLHPHLVLQDVVSGRHNPCIIDVKIGSRTWYLQASEDYIQRSLKKDRETTTLSLGFRISGLQIYDSKESGFWRPEKKLVLGFTADDVRVVLRKFVSSNSPTDSDSELDCSFASAVYGGSTGILAQLLELKAWFEDQTIFHFFSCSILMMYDKEAILKGMSSGAEIKLIDFAHVVEGEGVIDHNFLGGLCSLIKMISEILTSPDENPNITCLQDYEKNHSYLENGTTE